LLEVNELSGYICDMLTTIILLILALLSFLSFVKVMIYGRGIFRPDFDQVDQKFREKTGFPAEGRTSWNNTHGKIIYYFLLFSLIASIFFVMYYCFV